MRFCFLWVDETESWAHIRDFSDSEPVFFLEIREMEGHFPIARVLIRNPGEGLLSPSRRKKVFISVSEDQGQDQLLFSGHIVGVPVKMDGEMLEIMVSAEPVNATAQKKDAGKQLQAGILWDPYFVSGARDQDDFSEILDATPMLPFWSRTQENMKLTDIFRGSFTHDLKNDFFRDSLNLVQISAPLSEITVELKAEWIQSWTGKTDISSLIRSKFQGGLVNTFGGSDLENKWWVSGESLGRTGYWVEEAYLKKIPAPKSGGLGIYPAGSAKIRISPYDPFNEDGHEKEIRIERSWYRSKVVVGWHYRQKRSEILSFSLKNRVQTQTGHETGNRHLEITLRLPRTCPDATVPGWKPFVLYREGERVSCSGRFFQAICHHLSSRDFIDDRGSWEEVNGIQEAGEEFRNIQGSFFATSRGIKAFEHAVEIARTHLASSSRSVEITFQGAFEKIMHLACDHSVRIEDERLPGGKAWGKVRELRLVADGRSGRFYGEVKLACSVGCNDDYQPEPVLDNGRQTKDAWCFEGYCEDGIIATHAGMEKTISGIEYNLGDFTCSAEGIANPDLLSAWDIVDGVRVLNGPEEQEKALIDNQYPVRSNVSAVLREHSMEIILRLKDIQSLPQIKHEIQVRSLGEWSAPRQINLEAGKMYKGGQGKW